MLSEFDSVLVLVSKHLDGRNQSFNESTIMGVLHL